MFDREYAMLHLNGHIGDRDFISPDDIYGRLHTISMEEADREYILQNEFDLRSLDPRFDCPGIFNSFAWGLFQYVLLVNIWFTSGNIFKIKLDDIYDRIRVYR